MRGIWEQCEHRVLYKAENPRAAKVTPCNASAMRCNATGLQVDPEALPDDLLCGKRVDNIGLLPFVIQIRLVWVLTHTWCSFSNRPILRSYTRARWCSLSFSHIWVMEPGIPHGGCVASVRYPNILLLFSRDRRRLL